MLAYKEGIPPQDFGMRTMRLMPVFIVHTKLNYPVLSFVSYLKVAVISGGTTGGRGGHLAGAQESTDSVEEAGVHQFSRTINNPLSPFVKWTFRFYS